MISKRQTTRASQTRNQARRARGKEKRKEAVEATKMEEEVVEDTSRPSGRSREDVAIRRAISVERQALVEAGRVDRLT